tara:strand:- start:3034 stop:3432 length:399 start_codon:yes stop_codon:yes gene_type:complete
MGELFDGEEDIRNLFKRMLGNNIEIKDNLKSTEESVFVLFIEMLEKAKLKEELLLEAGLNIHEIVDPLWVVIENLLKLQFGPDSTELTMWYLYDRFGPDDKIIDLIDSKGKKVKLKNPKDLFKYLKYRFPSK